MCKYVSGILGTPTELNERKKDFCLFNKNKIRFFVSTMSNSSSFSLFLYFSLNAILKWILMCMIKGTHT